MRNITNKLRNNKEGFTIIEVVLVLAIAGLIFLIVFTALPQLQRSRRDTQRKRHAELLLASLVTYEGNGGSVSANTGAIHQAINGTTNSFSDYLDEDFKDPSGANYAYQANPLNETQIRVLSRYECVGSSWRSTGNTGDYLVKIGLEQGAFCVDNQ